MRVPLALSLLSAAAVVTVRALPFDLLPFSSSPGWSEAALLQRAAISERQAVSEGGVGGGDGDQFWHLRYHHWIAMASYNDAATFGAKCSAVFSNSSMTSLPTDGNAPFTVLDTWGPSPMGLQGFVVEVPVMDKIVLVIQEVPGWQGFNFSVSPPGYLSEQLNLGTAYENATANAQALAMYLDARTATDSWSTATQAVTATSYQFSVVGHGFAGAIAQIAALDFGWKGLLHYSHSLGAPRVFNAAAANLYDSLFEGQSGQRAVANNDSYPEWIPYGPNYTFTLTGVHTVTNTSSTLTMNITNCFDAEDAVCAGGSTDADHWFYFTPPGECGLPESTDQADVSSVEASLSSSGSALLASASASAASVSASSASAASASAASASSASASAASSPTAGSTPTGAAASSTASAATSGAGTVKVGGRSALVAWGLPLLMATAWL